MRACNCTLPLTNPQACKYCSNNTNWDYDYTLKSNDYYLEDSGKKLRIEVPLPGVPKENIKIRFIDCNLEITTISSIFAPEIEFYYEFDFKPSKEGITAYLENGVLEVTVAKPEKDILEVEIN